MSVNNKTIAAILSEGEATLSKTSSSPALDVQILLCEALGLSREKLLISRKEEVSPEDEEKFSSLLKRRAEGEPVAYIIGKRDFWNHSFIVTSAVLVPRPETEIIVEQALAVVSDRNIKNPVIVDIGTGSGCIACSVAAELKGRGINPRVIATDISKDALMIAAENGVSTGVDDCVEFRCGDLFAPLEDLRGAVDLLLSNPPYIPINDKNVSPECAFEPRGALYSGKSGLDTLKEMIERMGKYLKADGVAFFEHGMGQEGELSLWAGKYGFKAESIKDLQGINRTLRLQR